jgi:tetratricopeptide (TPR) repeat protein
LTLIAQDYETDFREIQRLFQERATTTPKRLDQHLDTYPYTPYRDEIKLLQGVLEVEKDKYSQALKIFNEITPTNLSRTSETMFYFHLGYTYLNMDKYDEALAILRPLKQKQNPYYLQAIYYIGYCYYKQNLYPQALSEFLILEELGGYQKIAPYYIVQIYYANGEYDKVFNHAKQLLTNNPDNDYNAELHRMIGEIYYQRGNYNEAAHYLKAYHQLRKNIKKDILRNDLYLLGISCYKNQMYDEAINYLKEIKLTPADSIAENTCLHLGHCYLRTNDIEKAKLSYAAAINFQLNDTLREEAMYNYVRVTNLQNSALGENITALNKFIEEYPNSRHMNSIYSLMADIYLNSKNYLKAIEALEKVANPPQKIQTTLQHLRFLMAIDSYMQGDRELTLHWCQEIINYNGGPSIYLTDAYYLKAEAEYLEGEYDKVIKTLYNYKNQVHYNQSLNKDNAKYLKAYTYFNKKKYDQALNMFEDYLKGINNTHETYTDALNRKGDCYYYLRKFNDANKTYQHVAEIAGKSEQAEYALMQRGMVLGLIHQYEKKVEVLEQLVKLNPKSDLADDAIYEIARAELQLEHHDKAIVWYEKLLNKQYRKSHLCAKASLELGMTWRTLKSYPEAIKAFEATVDKYPNTEEAYSALDGLEQIYIETNMVDKYIEYTKTLTQMNTQTATYEDSLRYVTAELQYLMNNYKQAATGFTTYLAIFPKGRYQLNATYYAASCYYQIEQYDQAIELYSKLADIQGNPYIETACMRVAELSYDKKDFATAGEYFKRMYDVASNQQKSQTALLGMLRCSYYNENDSATINNATEILKIKKLNPAISNEAQYYRASSYLRTEQYELALKDYAKAAKDTRTAWGAESKYRMAECYYLLNKPDKAIEEIMSFTNMQTTHQYWLAKSFILLADIFIDKGDIFQAKQYLLSLQNNYKQEDEILQTVSENLQYIDDLETSQNIDATLND